MGTRSGPRTWVHFGPISDVMDLGPIRMCVASRNVAVDMQIDQFVPDIVQHNRIINRSTDVGVSRTGQPTSNVPLSGK